MTCKILVVDDSTPIQKVIKIAFTKYAVEIFSAGSLNEALRECEKMRPDLIIADGSLPGVSTAGDFSRLMTKSQGAAMVMLMGSYDSVRESDLRAAGFDTIVKKPFDAIELLDACERMIPGKLVSSGSTFSGKEISQVTPPPPPPPFPPQRAQASRSGHTTVPPMEVPTFSLGETPIFATPAAPAPPSNMHQTPPSGGPQIPSFLLETPSSDVSTPSIPKLDLTQKGRPAFDSGNTHSNPQLSGDLPLTAQIARHQNQISTSAAASTGPVMSEDLLRRELPSLVNQAVENYCQLHFKAIAREVLTQELRRLAEEKAKFLVDQ